MGRGTRTGRIGAVTLVATMALGVGVAQAGGGSVKASNYVFKPKAMTVHKGDKVTWKWVNGRHTVTFKKGSYDKVLSKGNPKRSRTFKKRGTFRYICRFHRALGMKGKIVVQ
jgi:plastocyanin